MKKSLWSKSALWSLAVLPTAALAVAPEASQHAARSAGYEVGIRVLRPHVETASGLALPILMDGRGQTPKAHFKTDTLTGAVRVISGADLAGASAARSAASLEDVARQFVAANPDLFPLSQEDLVVSHDATFLGKEEQFLKMQVRRGGLLVEDASIDFRFKFGALVQVASQSFAEAADDQRPSVQGLERAASYALIEADVSPLRELYRVVDDKKGYRLVRVTQFHAETPSGVFLVSVENATGEVFEIRPTTFNLDGAARGAVHPRWYQEPLELRPYGDLKLTYTGGSVVTGADGSFRGLPQAARPKLDGFAGPKVRVELQSGAPVVKDGAPVRDQWHVVWEKSGTEEPSADTDVAQSMIFYHTNAIIRRAKQYIQTPWLDRELRANANLTRNCNAHWDGTTINFYNGGSGCANTGLIADVIFHEWGHGLDDHTGGIQDGAFSEGFGDIMSLVMTHSNILGIGFRLNGDPVRDLEPDRVYPRDTGGGVHSEGLIIGSTFYDLFKALRDQHGQARAGEILANYAFKMVFTAARYTDVYDALLVIDDDNGDLNDQTPNYCLINKAFADHGLARADQACALATVDAFQIDDRAGNGNGVIEPGESVGLWLTARNAGSRDAVNLTGRLAVQGASGVTVTRSDLAFGTVPARDVRRSQNAAQLAVARTAACGTLFTATVTLTSGDRTATVEKDLMVGRLAAQPRAVQATGLPVAIPDNGSVDAKVQVRGAEWQADTKVHAARLKFDITHTYVGDLTVKLTAPDGTQKQVYKGSGSADDVHFDEDVTALVKGLQGAGEWKLTVSDGASQDVGTLDAYQLTLTAAKFQCD